MAALTDHLAVRVYRLLGAGFVLMTLSTIVTYQVVQQAADPPSAGAGGSLQPAQDLMSSNKQLH